MTNRATLLKEVSDVIRERNPNATPGQVAALAERFAAGWKYLPSLPVPGEADALMITVEADNPALLRPVPSVGEVSAHLTKDMMSPTERLRVAHQVSEYSADQLLAALPASTARRKLRASILRLNATPPENSQRPARIWPCTQPIVLQSFGEQPLVRPTENLSMPANIRKRASSPTQRRTAQPGKKYRPPFACQRHEHWLHSPRRKDDSPMSRPPRRSAADRARPCGA